MSIRLHGAACFAGLESPSRVKAVLQQLRDHQRNTTEMGGGKGGLPDRAPDVPGEVTELIQWFGYNQDHGTNGQGNPAVLHQLEWMPNALGWQVPNDVYHHPANARFKAWCECYDSIQHQSLS